MPAHRGTEHRIRPRIELGQRFGAIGKSGGVGDIDERRIGQGMTKRFHHGKPAKPGIIHKE